MEHVVVAAWALEGASEGAGISSKEIEGERTDTAKVLAAGR